ncbi:hypothetical protein MPTK1_2g13750 [Marchantia polymorpha subsp. ruderalis]|uniref:Secreted protein n=1 Tax=Marchantia polymorpha TaxID=3197 RepID=A0A2R6X1G0_MARPO|nr:hypothetical protein MARPO_0042s0004 [Marchantia polymorpha]BBN02231.1 hypothetical protein Mp_2g13750 [Marchantia polymorpha subsp. ruderalis]|eukprot:PTQ39932.1 hypothetical protein MARPO_0042s0004 [Marchantia polymorpha]
MCAHHFLLLFFLKVLTVTFERAVDCATFGETLHWFGERRMTIAVFTGMKNKDLEWFLRNYKRACIRTRSRTFEK